MRSSSKLLSLASFLLLTQASSAPALRNVEFVLQVSTPGASTPVKNFYRAKNVQEEIKIDNFLTPLGQRQQFLVGTELRSRYVTESSDFLAKSFDISQLWIQSTFD